MGTLDNYLCPTARNLLTLSACSRVTVVSYVCLFVCLSVPSTLEPAAIRTLQLQSQLCLDATLQCLYCLDFLIKVLERSQGIATTTSYTTTGHFFITTPLDHVIWGAQPHGSSSTQRDCVAMFHLCFVSCLTYGVMEMGPVLIVVMVLKLNVIE